VLGARPADPPSKYGFTVMGFGSGIHWIIIALIVLVIFGNRLPSVMRSLGQGVVEFKKGLQGLESDVNNAGNKNESQPNQLPTDNKPSATESTPH
jgi:sec-independent protein translocase protein TatA